MAGLSQDDDLHRPAAPQPHAPGGQPALYTARAGSAGGAGQKYRARNHRRDCAAGPLRFCARRGGQTADRGDLRNDGNTQDGPRAGFRPGQYVDRQSGSGIPDRWQWTRHRAKGAAAVLRLSQRVHRPTPHASGRQRSGERADARRSRGRRAQRLRDAVQLFPIRRRGSGNYAQCDFGGHARAPAKSAAARTAG